MEKSGFVIHCNMNQRCILSFEVEKLKEKVKKKKRKYKMKFLKLFKYFFFREKWGGKHTTSYIQC